MDAHDKQALAYGRQKIADANAFPNELTYEQQQTQAAFLATATGNQATRMDILPMEPQLWFYGNTEFSLDNALASMDVRDGNLTYDAALRGLSDAETARAAAITTRHNEQAINDRKLANLTNTNMPALLVHLASLDYKTAGQDDVATLSQVRKITQQFDRLKTQMSNAGVPISSITTNEGAMEALEAMDHVAVLGYDIPPMRTLEESLCERLREPLYVSTKIRSIKPLSEDTKRMTEHQTDIIKPLNENYLIGKQMPSVRDTVHGAIGAATMYAIFTSKLNER